MASIIASLPPPLLANQTRRNTSLAAFPKLPLSSIKEQQNRVALVVRAGESSESSTPLSIVESVQNAWDNSEDRIAVVGLGFAAVVGLWASANLITAIDKLPVLPSVLEFVGILYSSWFIYRYLLFKPDRGAFSNRQQIDIKNLGPVIEGCKYGCKHGFLDEGVTRTYFKYGKYIKYLVRYNVLYCSGNEHDHIVYLAQAFCYLVSTLYSIKLSVFDANFYPL